MALMYAMVYMTVVIVYLYMSVKVCDTEITSFKTAAEKGNNSEGKRGRELPTAGAFLPCSRLPHCTVQYYYSPWIPYLFPPTLERGRAQGVAS